MRRFLIKEELAVDREYQKEKTIQDNSNTQNLLQLAKDKLSQNKTEDEDLDSNESDYLDPQSNNNHDSNDDLQQVNTSNSTNNYDDDSTSYLYSDTEVATGSSNMLNASGGEEDLNSGQEHLVEAAEISIILESLIKQSQEDWRDSVATYGSATFKGISASAAFLKDIGVQYGTPLLKAIGKTALYSITMALKGLFYSTKGLIKATDNSLNSYKKLYQRLQTIEETLALIEQSKIKDEKSPNFYNNQKVIFNISNQAEFKPFYTLSEYRTFLNDYVAKTTDKVRSDLTGIRILSSSLLSGKISNPEEIMKTDNASKGLVKGPIKGYQPSSELVEVYSYPKLLPGHMTLIAYLPKKDLKDISDIYTAYHHSAFFFGYHLGQMMTASKVPYLNLSDAKMLYKEVLATAKQSEIILNQLKELKSFKDTIGLNLKGLLSRITDKINNTNINSTIIRFIALKMYFIQKCYTKNMIEIDKQNRKILFNYCRYIEASLFDILENKKSKD
jgi:hypothetical protein